MLTKEDALQKMLEYMKTIVVPEPIGIVEKATIQTEFGWLFFYQSKKFIDNGYQGARLVGQGPVIINKETGEVVPTGSRLSSAVYIQLYTKYGGNIETFKKACWEY